MSEEIKSHHLRALACDIEDCHNPQSWADYCRAAASRIEAQAAEIGRLRAEVATARREGMAGAAKRADAIARRFRIELPEKWKARPGGIPKDWMDTWEACAETAEEIAAAIRAAAKEGEP